MTATSLEISPKNISFLQFKEEILKDYYTAVLSRECSLLGRKEVLTGKAKFGIFGDERPSLGFSVMAKSCRKSPWPKPLKKETGGLVTTETKRL